MATYYQQPYGAPAMSYSAPQYQQPYGMPYEGPAYAVHYAPPHPLSHTSTVTQTRTGGRTVTNVTHSTLLHHHPPVYVRVPVTHNHSVKVPYMYEDEETVNTPTEVTQHVVERVPVTKMVEGTSLTPVTTVEKHVSKVQETTMEEHHEDRPVTTIEEHHDDVEETVMEPVTRTKHVITHVPVTTTEHVVTHVPVTVEKEVVKDVPVTKMVETKSLSPVTTIEERHSDVRRVVNVPTKRTVTRQGTYDAVVPVTHY